MAALAKLLRPEANKAPGPSRTFGSSHVITVLLTIGEAGSIGRGALAKQAGLGDGAIRTVIKRLKEDGYVLVKPAGCTLSAKGEQAYGELKRKLPGTVRLSKTSLTLGREQVALLVKDEAKRVRSGIEQRDASILAGATGATTYTIKGSRFQIPGSSQDCEKDFPSGAWSELRRSLHPVDGDVVIVCGSDDGRKSFIAAISSALTLLE